MHGYAASQANQATQAYQPEMATAGKGSFSAERLNKQSELERITERLIASAQQAALLASRVYAIGDGLFGAQPETSGDRCARDLRSGMLGTIEDQIDFLGYSLDAASAALIRIERL